jgi:hypothetical protein
MPREKFYEPDVKTEEVEQIERELAKFMQTDEWFAILGYLGANHEKLCVHSFDDSCDMHDAIYLTGAGFVNHHLQPVDDINAVVEGFVMGYFYGARETQDPVRHPSQLIPWIQRGVSRYKRK